MPDVENFFEEDDGFKEPFENVDAVSEKKEVRKVSKVKKKMKSVSNALWPFLELFEMLFL